MNIISRNQDVISGNSDLEHLYTIKDFPVFMGCVDQPQDNDVVADVNYHISGSTGMIQITPLLPLDVVYQAEHAPGLVGKEWLLHHKAFAGFILKAGVYNKEIMEDILSNVNSSAIFLE